MRKPTKRQVIALLLILCTLGAQLFIFSNSLKGGEESAKQSGAVVEVVRPSVEQILPAVKVEPTEDNVVRFVRKAAHFLEFALLGFLCCVTARYFTKKKSVFLTVPFGYCVLTALADEGIQLFSQGRAGRFTDVLIDSGGALTGLLFAFGCIALAGWIKNRKKEKKTPVQKEEIK
ncbi:MAG: VanZ family protein [Ruminococcaceae bacterium]|nr:VanZ family protein [Oscillospiraceae bacterium]